MNTVWQIVDLETDKVFFTTRDSQAERWNNDEQFDVTPSPSRRPVAGYTTWMLDSDTDKYSLKLGMEAFVPPQLTQAEKEELQTEERWGPPACEEWSHGWTNTETGVECFRCGVRRGTCPECGHDEHGVVCPSPCLCMFQVKKLAKKAWHNEEQRQFEIVSGRGE